MSDKVIKKIRTSDGDLQIDYNSLANLPTISNPNLLINANFKNPINQRGKSVYEEQTERYGIDRWLIYNGVKEEVHDGFITLKNTFDQDAWFGQVFEHPLNNNESYVITIDVGTIVGNVDVCISNQNHSTVRHTLKYGINTFVINPNEMTSAMERLIFTFGAGAAVDLGYVKLEQGTTATPFVPRLYGEELALCQRYYEKRSVLFFPKDCKVPATYYIAINGGQHFVPKRTNPNVTTGACSDNTGATISTSISQTTCNASGVKALVFGSECSASVVNVSMEFDAEIY